MVSSAEGEMIWIERENLINYNLVDDFMKLLSVFDNDNINEMMYERHKVDNNFKWIMKLY